MWGDTMGSEIAKLTRLIKKLPEGRVGDVVELVERIIEEDKEEETPDCPHCGTSSACVVKYGFKDGKQRYRRNSCRKTFSAYTKSAVESSRFGEAVWKQVIRDTLNGVSLDKTAMDLGTTHNAVFNMRHKILGAVEAAEIHEPTVLCGVCEVDDTYVLESVKGTKIPEDYYRGPRKRGAKASKPGISNEYVSIMAGVSRSGQIYTRSANRALPSKTEVEEIFDGHIGAETLILCDGAKGIGSLSKVADVSNVKNEEGSFYHINTVNGYHSFIKTRHNNIYHGVATKYLNRYNALFSQVFGSSTEERTEAIYNMLIARNGKYRKSISALKTLEILDLGQLVNT
jgi:transposase-like protein